MSLINLSRVAQLNKWQIKDMHSGRSDPDTCRASLYWLGSAECFIFRNSEMSWWLNKATVKSQLI